MNVKNKTLHTEVSIHTRCADTQGRMNGQSTRHFSVNIRSQSLLRAGQIQRLKKVGGHRTTPGRVRVGVAVQDRRLWFMNRSLS